MRLLRVISGGQTGVDIAALRAAKASGIPTGGWMPKGWKTLAGPRPEYEALYGMREHASRDYSARTAQNVTEADATLRIAVNFDSPGERCTLRWLSSTNRPFHDLAVTQNGHCYVPDPVDDILSWLRRFPAPFVLNVAGNSERTAPGIELRSELLLRAVFREVVASPDAPAVDLVEMPEAPR